MAVIANSCEDPPPFSDPNFCDNPCIQEAMDCREDPRLSQSIVGVDCTKCALPSFMDLYFGVASFAVDGC